VACGLHGNVADAVKAFVAYRPERHEPDEVIRSAYDEAYRRYRGVYAALRPVFATG
jgi:sugar (pentulose or hexulose) kinase